MNFVVALPLSYLLGAIPFGFLAVRIFLKKDVRTLGSGNIGATNVSRCFAPKWRLLIFFLVWLLDLAKGYVPVQFFLSGGSLEQQTLLGLAAVAGHCFSPFLGFKGGKGVSTVCGILLALDTLALLVGLAVFGFVLATTRVVALGSISLGFAIAITTIFREPETAFSERLPVSLLAIFLAFFIVWTHRANIRGLLRLNRVKERSR